MLTDLTTESGAGPLDATCTSFLPLLVVKQFASGSGDSIIASLVPRLRRDMSESTLVFVACLLHRYLSISPFLNQTLLEELFAGIRPYHAWPKPFCNLAIDLLRSLSMEAKSAGVSWRRLYEEFYPFLRDLPPTGKELDVHVFCSPDSSFGSVLEEGALHVPNEREITAGAIFSLLKANGIFANADSDMAIFQHVKILKIKKLRGIYRKVREALEQAVQIPVAADSSVFLMQRLMHLRRAAEKHILRELKEAGKKVEESSVAAVTNLYECLLRGIPFQFRVSRFAFDCALAGREVGTKWPRRNAMKPLKEIVAEALKVSSQTKRVTLRVLIEGGDVEFHHLVGAVVALGQLEPEQFKKIKLRFYVAPSVAASKRPVSLLSSFLARIDPWFAKTVAVNSRAALSLPPSSSTPPLLLHSFLADYVTYARQKSKLKVFVCECWQKSVSQNAQDSPSKYIVPFALNAEVGINAQARMFQVMNDLPASLSVPEIVACKAFKSRPPVLSLKLTTCSVKGVPKTEPDLEARAWSDLTLTGLVTNSSWLDFVGVPSNDLVGNAEDGGGGGGRLKPFRSRVRSIEIEGHNKGLFDICLDGVPYGPFQKVVISPCTYGDANSQDPRFVTVSVMSYNTLTTTTN